MSIFYVFHLIYNFLHVCFLADISKKGVNVVNDVVLGWILMPHYLKAKYSRIWALTLRFWIWMSCLSIILRKLLK